MNTPNKSETPYRTAGKCLVLSLFLILSSCRSNSLSPSPKVEPTFENVQQIFNSSCGGSNCHIGQVTSGVQLDRFADVINSSGNQYEKNIIQPGNASESPLIDKIEATPEFGSRMPFGRSPLPANEIALIKKWINDGATNN